MAAKRGLLCLCCCTPLFLLSLSLQQHVAEGQIYFDCLRNTSSLSGTFTQNLQTALRNFTSLSSQGTKYAANIVGSSGPDRVYAVFQCRGDLSWQSCSECMQNAAAQLPQSDCPKSVGARIQFDYCFLRYDNQSFFVLDTTALYYLCNTASTTDVVALTTIPSLMQNVTSQAPKQGGYASNSDSGFYAMAQCFGYLNQSECSQCLSSVSYRQYCDARIGERMFLASCYYRYEAYPFLEAASPAPSPTSAARPSPASSAPGGASLFLPPGDPPQSHGSKTPIAISVAVAGIVVVVGALLLWRYKASKIKGVKRLDKAESWPRQLLPSKGQVFSLKELEEATANFHPTNKLGEGGFGIVYKGTLLGGEQVAIKKLSIGSRQGKQEFLNEVNAITSVQHKNLIRLLGCCVEGPERILVYEYLPNKSLDFFLYGEARERTTLNWSTRYGIIVGMVKGLAYLHEESHIRIIHRDIKPSNILLDNQLNPVIADFGLARLVNENATHVNTRVAGTIGYLSPEYALRGALSEKVDVFSFGLVCLEVITGKQTVNSMLLTWVWEKYLQGKYPDLVDEKLGNAFSPEQVIRVVHVALLCTQENPKQRPAMSMVVLWLSGISDILEMPARPTFLDFNDPTNDLNHQTIASTSSTSSQSTNVSRYSGGVQSLSEIVDPR